MKPRRTWRKVLPIHPAAQLLPPLSEHELRELGKSIAARGLLHPIIIFPEPVGDGNKHYRYSLLDGVNRLDAMELVGIDFKIDRVDRIPSTVTVQGDVYEMRSPVIMADDCDDPFAFVLSVNLHRRHLTAEQKRDLIAKLLKAQPERSNRTIAKQTNVDDKTVAAVRGKLEATAEIPQLAKTVGADGKARTTHRKNKRREIGDDIAEKPRTAAEHDDGAPELAPQQIDPDHLISQFTAEVRAGGLEIAKQIETEYRPMLVERLHEVIDEIELEAEHWAKEAQRPEGLPDIPCLRRCAP
jgi:hypothetical protein